MGRSGHASGKSAVKAAAVTALEAPTARGAFGKKKQSPCDEMLEPSEQQEPGKSHSSDGRRSHNRPRSLWKKAPVMRYSSPASGKSPVKVTVVTPVGAATAEGVFEKNAPVMRCSYQGSGKSPVKVTEVTAVGATTAGGAFEKSPCDEMLVPRRGESLGSDGAWSRHRRVSRARARASVLSRRQSKPNPFHSVTSPVSLSIFISNTIKMATGPSGMSHRRLPTANEFQYQSGYR